MAHINDLYCLLLFFQILQERKHSNLKQSRRPLKFGTAEKKIFIVLCYYVLLSIVSLTALSLNTGVAGPLRAAIERYFICELGGHNPSDPCSRSEFEKFTYPWVTTLAFILLSLLPFVNLVYAVTIQDAKQLCRRLFR